MIINRGLVVSSTTSSSMATATATAITATIVVSILTIHLEVLDALKGYLRLERKIRVPAWKFRLKEFGWRESLKLKYTRSDGVSNTTGLKNFWKKAGA